MFSSNDKISSRQIKRLLVFDIFGAGSLLLPSQLAMSENGIGIFSILAGTFFAGAYLWLLRICASRTESDYLNYLKTGWGNILARLCYLGYALISIITCAWAAKILTQLVCDSLLDSVDFAAALFVIMLLAYYGASAGIEARARVYEILFWVLVIPLLIMLALCVRQVQVIQWFPLLGEQDVISWSWFFIGTWRCFAAFLPLTFLLFLLPHVQDKRKSQRAAGWAVLLIGAALLLGFGVGTVQSCGLAMAVRVSSDERLGVANATFYMLLDVGVGIGPVLLGALVPLIGYSALYLCMAAVGLLALALFLVVAKTEKGAR